MKVLPDPICFEWDEGNKHKNLIRHKVTIEEIEQAFDNEPKFIFKDESHSTIEDRYGMFGQTNKNRLLSLVFTVRDDKIRIITARNMSRKERKTYEQTKTDSKF